MCTIGRHLAFDTISWQASYMSVRSIRVLNIAMSFPRLY